MFVNDLFEIFGNFADTVIFTIINGKVSNIVYAAPSACNNGQMIEKSESHLAERTKIG